MRAQLRREHGRAQVFQQPSLRDDVADIRDIVQHDRLGCEQGGGHAGQRGIFRAADPDAATQRASARDTEFIHV